MPISITRLSGGNTPADGSDPRTFPAIWNATAQTLEDNVGAGGASVTTSDTAPADPAEGDMWWKSDDGKLFVYYNDGDSSQWVDAAGPSVAVQSTAPTGYEGQLWLDDTDGSMYVYYTDPGGGASSWIGAVSRSGGILQVVSTTKTATFSVSDGSFQEVTGLSATITPSSTSSKIMVIVTCQGRASGGSVASVFSKLIRNSTDINIGDASGSDVQASVGAYQAALNGYDLGFTYLDSPATTSSTTYKVAVRNESATAAAFTINYGGDTSSSGVFGRLASSITLMEVAG